MKGLILTCMDRKEEGYELVRRGLPPGQMDVCAASARHNLQPFLRGRIAALAAMLGLSRVGVMIAHPAREYAFSVDEIRLAAKLHQAALVVEPEKALGFVTMKARPVLQHEEIEGVATMEAYQLTDQCIALCEADAFVESASDPRVAKTSNKECVFLVEKRPQRKATMESFITRVFVRLLANVDGVQKLVRVAFLAEQYERFRDYRTDALPAFFTGHTPGARYYNR